MGIFKRKSKAIAVPFPDGWVPGDPVQPFSSRWGADPHNEALIEESALWSRFVDTLPPDEVRWMVGPVTVVFPDLNDIRMPGFMFCTDHRFIVEVTPEGAAWFDYRTMEIPLRDVRTLCPSRFGNHILMIGYANGTDDVATPDGLFMILQTPAAPYLYAVMGHLVCEKAGLKNLGKSPLDPPQ